METTRKRHILTLWNGKSGNASLREQVFQKLQLLDSVGYEVSQVEPAGPEEAAEIAAAAGKGTVIVAAGGDGTVHAIAQGLLRRHRKELSSGAVRWDQSDFPSGPALAVLPMGTANDLARSLAIPLDPLEAIRILEYPSVRRIDTVYVSADGREEWMLNAAAGGNAAEVARRAEGGQKQRWGAWCYVPGVVEVVANLEDYQVRFQIDGKPEENVDTFALVVANGRTTATMEVAACASVEDGQLDLIIVKGGPLPRTAGVAAEFFAGDYLQNDQVIHRRGRVVRIECDLGISFSIDGEIWDAKMFQFTLCPATLPVVVGENYSDERRKANV